MPKLQFLAAILIGLAAPANAEPAPAPAYIIGDITVTDPEGYKAYMAAITPVVAKFGGTYLVRGGQTVAYEGHQPAGRTVVIAFPSLAAAKAFHADPANDAAAEIRQRTAKSGLFIVEGVAPPAE